MLLLRDLVPSVMAYLEVGKAYLSIAILIDDDVLKIKTTTLLHNTKKTLPICSHTILQVEQFEYA